MSMRRIALAIVTAMWLSACAGASTLDVAFPDGCAEIGLTDRRCATIVDVAGERLGIDPGRAHAIRLSLGPACPSGIDARCITSREPFVLVRFAFRDGTTAEDGLSCYGVGREVSLLCADPPAIGLAMGVDRDVPCPGDPPDGCATPVPTIDPAMLGDASPLVVGEVEIPLTQTGHYDIPLGTADLPNGVLSEARFDLDEQHQAGFLLEDGVVRLVVRGPSGQELRNVHETGWTPGVVTVSVALAFDGTEADPDTALHVRDVRVR
jgi:hypothetical protein